VNSIETDKSIVILLVEDNPGDVRLIQEAFRDAQMRTDLQVAEDGEKALAFLRAEGGGDVPRPDLILLDLNLPRKDGREVLIEIKNDERLKRIPVVILSASHSEEDITRAYDLRANCYVTKPLHFDRFIEVVRSIEVFWLTAVELPKE